MNTLAQILLVALYINSVYCSYYHGPTAKPVVLHNGFLEDTHEVAAAKNDHLAALARESHYGGHSGYGGDYGYGGSYGYSHGQEYSSGSHEGHHGDIRYHGPTAIPHVLHDGHIADTHEVAAAKAEHFAAVNKAKAHGGDGNNYSGGYASGYGADHGHSHHVAPYHGPLAKPVVLKSGYLADTHEVAAAKAEHFAAVNKAKAHGGDRNNYSGGYTSGYGADHGHSHHVTPYHGPLAKPVVLKSGYLADTHEVTVAREHHLGTLHDAGRFGQYGYHY